MTLLWLVHEWALNLDNQILIRRFWRKWLSFLISETTDMNGRLLSLEVI
jgi:hypothetical protein